MAANTYGRQVVIPLTNKSGGSVAAGDVVVIDTTTDESFTTTTTGQAELSVGIAQETIASNAIGRVLTHGYAALVNVPSSRTRGQYIETHTVAKQATGSGTRRAGSCGQFLTTSATPTGWLWGQTDQTAAAGAAGALVFRQAQTASASATLDFTTFYSSSYDDYLIDIVSLLPATDAVGLTMQVSTDGGSTWASTTYNWSYNYLVLNGASAGNANGAADSSFRLANANSSTASRGGVSGAVKLYNPGSATANKPITYDIVQPNSGDTNMYRYTGGGWWGTTTAVNALRFAFTSGNITSGVIRIYGLSKT